LRLAGKPSLSKSARDMGGTLRPGGGSVIRVATLIFCAYGSSATRVDLNGIQGGACNYHARVIPPS
jgi:hypothetical protein